MRYRNAFEKARLEPDTFWAEQARELAWYRPRNGFWKPSTTAPTAGSATAS